MKNQNPLNKQETIDRLLNKAMSKVKEVSKTCGNCKKCTPSFPCALIPDPSCQRSCISWCGGCGGK